MALLTLLTLPSTALVVLSILILRALYRLTLHPLARVPGPVGARLSRIPLLLNALSGSQHQHHLSLHERYGSVVRIGPSHVLLSSPSHGAQYYTWPKSDWWLCFRPSDDALAFSTELGLKEHNAKKKRVAAAYSLTSLLGNEAKMNEIVSEWLGKMKEFSNTGEQVDMAAWMNWLNFDVLMEMVFGASVGCVRAGKDTKGLIAANEVFVKMANVIGVFPVLYKIMQWSVMRKWAPKSTDKEGAGLLFGISERSVKGRLEEQEKSEATPRKRKDILQHMVDYRDLQDQGIPAENLQNEAIVAMASGADTVGCTLRVAALYLSTNAPVRAKLVAEIDDATAAGNLSKPARFEELRRLPYLAAVVQELVRIHPVMASPFWRSAPRGGVMIDGHFLPEGTHVGINEWVIARNTDLYGKDVECFRPERWLDCSLEKKRERDKMDLFFGHGDYMCLGKSFATLELYKVIVELWREFEVVIVNPERPWKSSATISFVHENFLCTIHPRR